MSAEDDYLKCVNKLEECVCEIKNITHRLSKIVSFDVRNAIFDIEAGVEKLEHELEADIKKEKNV